MTPEELNGTRLFVLQRAICALIVTHPDPSAFARAFGAASALQQLDQLAFARSRPDVRDESAAFARELLELAADEVARRQAAQTPPAG
jgi:hypothetical protein